MGGTDGTVTRVCRDCSRRHSGRDVGLVVYHAWQFVDGAWATRADIVRRVPRRRD